MPRAMRMAAKAMKKLREASQVGIGCQPALISYFFKIAMIFGFCGVKA